MSTTILIDGDILAYQSAAAVDFPMPWGDGTYTSFGDVDEAYGLVRGRVEDIVTAFGGNAEPVVALSCEGDYWRHQLLPLYKAHRVQIRPVVLQALREAMEERDDFQTVVLPRLEADDVLGILATSGVYTDPIVFSVDKDLDTIPCRRSKEPGVVYRVTEEQADRNHLLQAFHGDPTDGYAGCPGVGPKTAAKILAPYLDGLRGPGWAWAEIVKRYEKKKMTAHNALTMARVARILRSGDYDRDTGAVELWMPPKPEKPEGDSC